jgi:hypothetical protein
MILGVALDGDDFPWRAEQAVEADGDVVEVEAGIAIEVIGLR